MSFGYLVLPHSSFASARSCAAFASPRSRTRLSSLASFAAHSSFSLHRLCIAHTLGSHSVWICVFTSFARICALVALVARLPRRFRAGWFSHLLVWITSFTHSLDRRFAFCVFGSSLVTHLGSHSRSTRTWSSPGSFLIVLLVSWITRITLFISFLVFVFISRISLFLSFSCAPWLWITDRVHSRSLRTRARSSFSFTDRTLHVCVLDLSRIVCAGSSALLSWISFSRFAFWIVFLSFSLDRFLFSFFAWIVSFALYLLSGFRLPRMDLALSFSFTRFRLRIVSFMLTHGFASSVFISRISYHRFALAFSGWIALFLHASFSHLSHGSRLRLPHLVPRCALTHSLVPHAPGSPLVHSRSVAPRFTFTLSLSGSGSFSLTAHAFVAFTHSAHLDRSAFTSGSHHTSFLTHHLVADAPRSSPGSRTLAVAFITLRGFLSALFPGRSGWIRFVVRMRGFSLSDHVSAFAQFCVSRSFHVCTGSFGSTRLPHLVLSIFFSLVCVSLAVRSSVFWMDTCSHGSSFIAPAFAHGSDRTRSRVWFCTGCTTLFSGWFCAFAPRTGSHWSACTRMFAFSGSRFHRWISHLVVFTFLRSSFGCTFCTFSLTRIWILVTRCGCIPHAPLACALRVLRTLFAHSLPHSSCCAPRAHAFCLDRAPRLHTHSLAPLLPLPNSHSFISVHLVFWIAWMDLVLHWFTGSRAVYPHTTHASRTSFTRTFTLTAPRTHAPLTSRLDHALRSWLHSLRLRFTPGWIASFSAFCWFSRIALTFCVLFMDGSAWISFAFTSFGHITSFSFTLPRFLTRFLFSFLDPHAVCVFSPLGRTRFVVCVFCTFTPHRFCVLFLCVHALDLDRFRSRFFHVVFLVRSLFTLHFRFAHSHWMVHGSFSFTPQFTRVRGSHGSPRGSLSFTCLVCVLPLLPRFVASHFAPPLAFSLSHARLTRTLSALGLLTAHLSHRSCTLTRSAFLVLPARLHGFTLPHVCCPHTHAHAFALHYHFTHTHCTPRSRTRGLPGCTFCARFTLDRLDRALCLVCTAALSRIHSRFAHVALVARGSVFAHAVHSFLTRSADHAVLAFSRCTHGLRHVRGPLHRITRTSSHTHTHHIAHIFALAQFRTGSRGSFVFGLDGFFRFTLLCSFSLMDRFLIVHRRSLWSSAHSHSSLSFLDLMVRLADRIVLRTHMDRFASFMFYSSFVFHAFYVVTHFTHTACTSHTPHVCLTSGSHFTLYGSPHTCWIVPADLSFCAFYSHALRFGFMVLHSFHSFSRTFCLALSLHILPLSLRTVHSLDRVFTLAFSGFWLHALFHVFCWMLDHRHWFGSVCTHGSRLSRGSRCVLTARTVHAHHTRVLRLSLDHCWISGSFTRHVCTSPHSGSHCVSRITRLFICS